MNEKVFQITNEIHDDLRRTDFHKHLVMLQLPTQDVTKIVRMTTAPDDLFVSLLVIMTSAFESSLSKHRATA